jgi:protoporphyrinogen oxidase
MEKYKYLILGAGPSGLAFAHTLLENGEKSFLILEKENQAGGLCRSEMVDGSPLDIGGGHFLDVRIPGVLDFLFRFIPENEWNLFQRKSSIDFGDYRIDYPMETNLWQLPLDQQVDHIQSLAYSGENLGIPKPDKFEEWIIWKLGKKIAEDYMFPYNRKIWSVSLDQLGTYWMEKLPSISFKEIVLSCLSRKSTGTVPAHKSFYYPKNYGYGEVWDRMGIALGNRLRLSTPVRMLNIDNRIVNNTYTATMIINTLPWNSISLEGCSNDIKNAVRDLKQTGVQIDYHPNSLETEDQWVYIPDEKTSYHRILNRKGFIPGAIGCWTETNLKRANKESQRKYINEYAYPLNTVNKPQQIKTILDYSEKRKVFGLGRWGTWEHINSDIAVFKAIGLAEKLVNNSKG